MDVAGISNRGADVVWQQRGHLKIWLSEVEAELELLLEDEEEEEEIEEDRSCFRACGHAMS